ncbi:hypothetical protein D910_06057, partial [Dendroctonus ponderosae]
MIAKKTVGKELAIDPSFEFEKRRHVPVKYSRETFSKAVEAMKKVETIRQRRQGAYIMQRLRKGRELEQERDVKEVQRDLALIRSPAAGLKRAQQDQEMAEESNNDSENEEDMEGVVEYCGEVTLKTLERLYSTSLNPVQKDTEEQYNKELKRFDRLTNIEKRTRPKKPQREPFVKNLLVGKYDNEILTFPELDLGEVRNVEKAVEELGKVLKQNHMVNVSSIGNKQFRQTLADYQAIGLQCSQFLDAKECCPMEFTRYLDTLAEHKLGANLIDNEVMGIQALNTFANVDLQKKYLYPLIKGEMVSAFAIIENELFDLKNMMTTAVLSSDKKHW